MSTATFVPETRALSGVDAKDVLRRTGRGRLLKDSIKRFSAADGSRPLSGPRPCRDPHLLPRTDRCGRAGHHRPPDDVPEHPRPDRRWAGPRTERTDPDRGAPSGVEDRWQRRSGTFWGGGILILIGIYFLLANLGLLNWLDWNIAWPVILIALGIWLVVRRLR